MIESLWDGEALTTSEHDHLALCTECQNAYAVLGQMRAEFEVARHSKVQPEAEARLFAIFEDLPSKSASQQPLQRLLDAMVGWVQALPLWDSRQQAGAIGIRSANLSSYRILFGTDETEIELMVEPQNEFVRIMGEVSVTSDPGANGLALIELATSADAKTAIETESDINGRFALNQVPPGVYQMTITPRYSQMVVIEALELT